MEEQIEAAQSDKSSPKPPDSAADASRKRERQNLELARKRLVHRIAAAENPAFRKLLEDALAELDERLAKLK